MSHYAISAIHWNANLGAIDEVQLHRFVRQHDGTYAVSHGEPAWCSDVVQLIHGGHRVWVVVRKGPDRYLNTDHVRVNVNPGGFEYLYSCTGDGTPTAGLMELPRYARPDDAPPMPVRPLDDTDRLV